MLRLVFFAASAYPVGRMMAAAFRLSIRAGMLPCLAFLLSAVWFWPCLWLEILFGPNSRTRTVRRFRRNWQFNWLFGKHRII